MPCNRNRKENPAMGWNSAVKAAPAVAAPPKLKPKFDHSKILNTPMTALHRPDWERLVTLDFETYYDMDYTLRKLSTSEYIRDERFHAQMVGLKIRKNA